MMTMQIDMTAELAAIPYGLVIALGISFIGILMSISRHQIGTATAYVVGTYHHYRETLRRRHIRMARSLSTASGF